MRDVHTGPAWYSHLYESGHFFLFSVCFLIPAEDMENFDVAALPLDSQRNIEADSFWCMSKLLDGIQV